MTTEDIKVWLALATMLRHEKDPKMQHAADLVEEYIKTIASIDELIVIEAEVRERINHERKNK